MTGYDSKANSSLATCHDSQPATAEECQVTGKKHRLTSVLSPKAQACSMLSPHTDGIMGGASSSTSACQSSHTDMAVVNFMQVDGTAVVYAFPALSGRQAVSVVVA